MKNFYILGFLFLSINIFSQQNIQDDFEGNGTITTWSGDDCDINTNYSNPFKTGINTSDKVLQYDDIGGSYANIRFDTSSNLDLSVKNTFSIKIYVSASDVTGSQENKVSLKLQNNKIAEPWTTQTEIIKPIVLNSWQTIEFDFKNDGYINLNATSGAPVSRADFNRVLIQINGENNKDLVTAYIDDIAYYESTYVNQDPVFDQLVWSDEFDGQSGVSVDLDNTKWFKQTYPILGGQSWANGEVQHYTDRIDNSYISNGTLKIVAKKETYTNSNNVTKNYTSARLNSKYAFTYGKVEIKAKMPFGVGTFPALWMLGQNITETGGYWAATHGTTAWPDCGEVDIIEHWGDNQDFVQSALHNRSSFGGTVNKGGQKITNASTEFHIYTLEWSEDKMIFSVDGNVHYTYNPSIKNIENWPYSAPQYLLFNVAILPNITAGFTESAMEVDYVRIYQESTASVSKNDNLLEVTLFPNPVNNELNIQFSSDLNAIKGTIYTITGQKIQEFYQKSKSKKIDVSNLTKGIYFLRLASEKGTSLHKIIKN
ncbi:family 16 glycosylhydrolase [Polaribacter vadi]|uniref:family 16 glycosylhydrolase n=1 Tax=Polaribacter vadi TaxID=1774273 RepID=UPI0030EC3565|tara:strand:+ start:1074 stop:2696 length:1623 start_codon:yes stop_codon:yes gene_type:complete